MPADQTAAFSDHLAQRTGLPVIETSAGEVPAAGSVAVLKGGANYRIARAPSAVVLRRSLAEAGPYRPSIDMLFGSAAEAGLCCDVVVLSGMGEDGADGAVMIEAAGGRVLVQRPDSCVVAGMPAATLAACRSAQALAPAVIAARLAHHTFATQGAS
jgi:two-component system chemotaxis response regulator CheB